MELLHYWAIVRRWWWLLLLSTFIAGVSAFVYSIRVTPVYEATVQVLIQQASNPANMTSYADIVTSQRLASTYARLMKTQPVLGETLKELGLENALSVSVLKSNISVRPVRDTSLLLVKVQDTDPQRAVRLANALPKVFARYNERIQLARFQDSKRSLEEQLNRLGDELAQIQNRLQALKKTQTADSNEIMRLEMQRATIQASYTNLLKQYEEIRLAEARSLDTIAVSEPATHATKVKPQTVKNTLLAALVGLMLALGGVFFLEYIDDSIKTPDDIVHLGDIPILSGITETEDARFTPLITHVKPKSPVSEAFRILRTNIQFASVDKPTRTVTITSPGPSEGKSFLTANLGIVMAQQGRRVIIIDADLRKPMQHKLFELPNNVGLTTLLLVEDEDDILPFVQSTNIGNLRVLTSGPIPPNPSELLGSRRMGELMAKLLEDADILLFDTPPALAVTDAIVLSKRTDGVVVVVRAKSTRIPALLQVLMELERVGSHLLGVVLNALPAKGQGYYSYYYHSYSYYYYYYEEEKPSSNGRRKQEQSAKKPFWHRYLG